MSNTQAMAGTFSRQEVLSILLRKKQAAELHLISVNQKAKSGNNWYKVKKSELQREAAFWDAVLNFIAKPQEDFSMNEMRERPIIELPISVRLYNILKKNLGKGSDRVLIKEIESIPLSEIRDWPNFGKTTEKELIELCELNDIKLQP